MKTADIVTGINDDTDYAYDLADNLVEVVYPSGRIVAYARDGLGRVTAGSGDMSRVSGSGDMTRVFRFFKAVAVPRAAPVDAGRLVTVKDNGVTAATYAHNALGQRVIKTAGAATTHYHYDRGGRLLAESDGTGAPIREYIHLDGLPLALITATGEILYVHPDHLATPQKMTDAAQTVVWDGQLRPFGEAHGITGPASNDQRFPGQFHDAETGFHYNYFRDYDPSTGRYLQSDPIGLAGGLNTYDYALGNPVSYVDSDGRNPVLFVIIGGAVTGALVDAGLQLLENGGQLACLDYGQIGRSAAIGGALGGLGRVGIGLLRSVPKRGLGNPFKNKTPQQIDEMFMKKGFEGRGPDPMNGKGGYVNPKNGRSYHIDEANSFGEPPHVDVNRLSDYKGLLPKKKLPM